MTPVNGLCVSVLNDSYRITLSAAHNGSPQEIIEVDVPLTASIDESISILSSKFANLDPSSQTIICTSSTASTVQLRRLMTLLPNLGVPTPITYLTYTQAYLAGSLSAADCPITIHFLECSRASSETALLHLEFHPDIDEIVEGTDTIRSVVHLPTQDASARADTVIRELVDSLYYSEPANKRIVLLNPDADADLLAVLKPALEKAKPDVPVHVASPAELAAAAARYVPRKSRDRVTAQYVIPLPISIATADGTAIIAMPRGRKLRPAQDSVLLTTSTDDQTSVTLAVYLGDHLRAEDNLYSGTVVLKGLIPQPKKGKARIRATIVVSHETGATITVEQVLDGDASPPKVVATFPDLIKHLGHDYERYETTEGQRSAPFVEGSEEPVGELPA